MIKTETVTIDGRTFVHTWSDGGFFIERDGVRYAEAYDPQDSGRTYAETNDPVESDDEEDVNEYEEAGKILMGVEERQSLNEQKN